MKQQRMLPTTASWLNVLSPGEVKDQHVDKLQRLLLI